jgi:hypothetical protein
VDLKNVKEIVLGQDHEIFERHKDNIPSHSEGLSFSLFLPHDSRPISLICSESATLNAFYSIIKYLSIEKKAVNPMCCIASGVGLHKGVAGSPFHFTIEPKDSLGISNTKVTFVDNTRLYWRFYHNSVADDL